MCIGCVCQQTVIIMPCPALIDSMKYLQHGHCVRESSSPRIYLCKGEVVFVCGLLKAHTKSDLSANEI